MGEMADFHIGQMQEAFPSWSPTGWEPSSRHRIMRCKYCNAPGLKWFQTERGWRLVDAHDHEKVHTCEQYGKAKALRDESPKD